MERVAGEILESKDMYYETQNLKTKKKGKKMLSVIRAEIIF